jgi:hypothetical protein
MPADWERQLVVIRTPALPSTRQLAHALAGTHFSPEDTVVVDLADLASLVTRERPDVVLLSVRGPVVRVLVRVVRMRRHFMDVAALHRIFAVELWQVQIELNVQGRQTFDIWGIRRLACATAPQTDQDQQRNQAARSNRREGAVGQLIQPNA